MEAPAAATSTSSSKRQREAGAAELAERLQAYLEVKRNQAVRDGRCPWNKGHASGVAAATTRPPIPGSSTPRPAVPGSSTPSRPLLPAAHRRVPAATAQSGGGTSSARTSPRKECPMTAHSGGGARSSGGASASRPSRGKENDVPAATPLRRRPAADGRASPPKCAGPAPALPAAARTAADGGRAMPSTPSMPMGPHAAHSATARTAADSKAGRPVRTPRTRAMAPAPTGGAADPKRPPTDSKRPPPLVRGPSGRSPACPEAQVDWNDIEEMYSFDSVKIEDMITKGRTASAVAGAEELEEVYSFDLAKVEDLVRKTHVAGGNVDTEDAPVADQGTGLAHVH